MIVYVKRLNKSVDIPKPARPGDAAVDLQAAHSRFLGAGDRAVIDTGIAVQIPEGYCGLVTPRSGWAKKGVGIVNSPGLIDSGYRGEISVLVINHGQFHLEIVAGQRIAQLLILPAPIIEFVLVEELDSSERGEQGFGSTGL